MIERIRFALAAALLLLLPPVVASAQHGAHAAPHVAPAPAVTPIPSSEDEGNAWFEDDLIAFGLGDEFEIEDADNAEGADEDMTLEETPSPDGERRTVVRRIRVGPGAMGHGPRMGMGVHGGKGMRALLGRRGGDEPMMHRRMGMGMRFAHLDLTDAQRDKLRALHETQARKAVQRRADTQLARMDLRKLMRADKPDPAAVNAQIDRLARLRADAMKAGFDTRMQARAVLTPEQLKKLRSGVGVPKMRHEMGDFEEGARKR